MLNLLINCVSDKSTPQILPINGESTFLLSKNILTVEASLRRYPSFIGSLAILKALHVILYLQMFFYLNS